MSGMEAGGSLDWVWVGSLCVWLLSAFGLIIGGASLLGYWRDRRRAKAARAHPVSTPRIRS